MQINRSGRYTTACYPHIKDQEPWVGEATLFPELPGHAVNFECPEEHLGSYRQLLHSNDIELVTIEQATNAEQQKNARELRIARLLIVNHLVAVA